MIFSLSIVGFTLFILITICEIVSNMHQSLVIGIIPGLEGIF